jgi:hypothetical protein
MTLMGEERELRMRKGIENRYAEIEMRIKRKMRKKYVRQ